MSDKEFNALVPVTLKDCVPETLTLFEFQKETITRTLNFLFRNETAAAYVANEPGLGKTITGLATANYLMRARVCSRVLIVAPAIMKLVWEEEIYKWCRFHATSIPSVCVIETASDVQHTTSATFVICSYALAATDSVLSELLVQKFDLLIVDEAHAIKNYKALRTKAVKKLFACAKYKILMSGTPFSTNVVDGYVPFSLILPSKFPRFTDFAAKYSYIRITHWGAQYYGLKNAEELSQIIRNNFYIRYKKEQVLKELPAKIFQRIVLPETFSVKVDTQKYKILASERQQIFEAIQNDKTPPIPSCLAEHRRLQGEKKVPAVVDFVQEQLEQQIPIVLFAYHKKVIADLAEALKEFKPVIITGETSAANRQAAIEAFQEGKTLLFIGNIIAAGTGITLTKSSTVVLAELDWVPTNIAQAIERVHRIGQANQVIVYYFIVRNSLDETMDELVIRRTKEFAKVLD